MFFKDLKVCVRDIAKTLISSKIMNITLMGHFVIAIILYPHCIQF
jgi:hypothetical protein